MIRLFLSTTSLIFLFSLNIYSQPGKVVMDTLIIFDSPTAVLATFEDDIFDIDINYIPIDCNQFAQLSLDVCLKEKDPFIFCPTVEQPDEPVCGCNVTYPNICLARMDGIIDWYDGECSDIIVDPVGTGLAKAKKKKKVGARPQGEICDGILLDITWTFLNPSGTDSIEITKTFCINQLCGNNVCLPGLLSLGYNTLSSNTTYRAESILSNSTIPINRNITFKAEEDITLLSGFHAKSGSNFTAIIEPCSSSSLTNQGEPISQINQEKRIPTNELTLEVYPNPIKNQSTIKFGLPKATPIELSIYTLQGQNIQQISKNSVYDKGQHQIQWNPSNLPEGMYLVSLKTGDQELIKKIIIQ